MKVTNSTLGQLMKGRKEQRDAGCHFAVHGVRKDGELYVKPTFLCLFREDADRKCALLHTMNPGKAFRVVELAKG